MWISNIEVKMIKMTKNYWISDFVTHFFELFRVVQYFSQLGVQTRSVWEMDAKWMDAECDEPCYQIYFYELIPPLFWNVEKQGGGGG